MTERAITKRVNYLGGKVGIERLSARDLRHSWATQAARNKTDPFALKRLAGGLRWRCRGGTSMMPRLRMRTSISAGVRSDARANEPIERIQKVHSHNRSRR